MKKQALIFILFLLGMRLSAQDNSVLKSILVAGSEVNTIDADLYKRFEKNNTAQEHYGKLYFVKPYKFAAKFNTGKYMIVNEKRIKINIGLFYGNIRLKNGPLRSLSHIFLFAFQGRCEELAEENNYSIHVKTENNYHVVTFIKNKRTIGLTYKKVVFKFDIKDLRVKEIVLYDTNNSVDSYIISNVQYNVKVNSNLFDTN
jgi:outer membrane lipoprotein-sorting protein